MHLPFTLSPTSIVSGGSLDVSSVSQVAYKQNSAPRKFHLFYGTGLSIGIWNSLVKKPSYGLWRHKTELSQIVTSKLIFCNSEILEWQNENKKTELRNSEILLNI